MTLQDGIATDEMSDDKRRRRKRWRRKRMMMRRREKKKTKERLGTASHSAALSLSQRCSHPYDNDGNQFLQRHKGESFLQVYRPVADHR